MPAALFEESARPIPRVSTHGRLLDDLVVVRVDPESAGVQRRIDGLLHDVKRRSAEAARRKLC